MTTPSEPLSLILRHQPYGEQHPYDPLPYERFPRDPSEGEPVTIGVETGHTPIAESVWCIWQLTGSSTLNRVEGVRVSSGETSDLWHVHLPAFGGGVVVHYRLFARSKEQQASSEEFTFSVSTWVEAVSIAVVEENTNQLSVVLTTEWPNLYLRLQVEPDHRGAVSLRLSAFYEMGSIPTVLVTEQPLTVEWGDMCITLRENPLRLEMQRKSDGLTLQSSGPIQLWMRGRKIVVRYHLGFVSPVDEAFYGFGERFNALDQRGNHLDNHVYAQYTGQGRRSYIPVPYFISSRGYGLWLKTELQAEFDLAAAESSRWTLTGNVEEDDALLDMRFFFQQNPREIVQAFTDLTGKPKLPPTWAFGLWMSSNDWNSQVEILRQMHLTQQHQIPASVLVIEAWSDEVNFYIWNDAQYQQKHSSQAYHLSDYTFPEAGRWPDPKAMTDELHRAGLRLVLWQIPVMKRGDPAENLGEMQKNADQEYAIRQGYIVRRADGSPHQVEATAPWFGGSMVFDFTHPEAERWWFDKREYLLSDMGVDGFKTDGGEHVWDTESYFHNGMRGIQGINHYPLAYESAYHRFLESHRGEDHVLFSRAGYTGVQQFSCHWTGDEVSTWEAFRATLHAMLNVGLCGVSFIGWDIGGFAGNIPSSDLYLRASAFSAFCPIMQYHSDYNARRKPSRDRTPWNIQEQTGHTDVVSLFRQYANLRMNLIPYIIEEAREISRSGLPLMRALPLEYPADTACRDYPYEYLFGEALLVAPVMEEERSTWPVYLPEGEWRDFWSGTFYRGSQEITVPAPLERIPVFQRRGSIVPLNLGDTLELCSQVGNSTEEMSNLAALIYPGDACRIEMYQGRDHIFGSISSWRSSEDESIQVTLQGLKLAVDLLVLGDEPHLVVVNGINLPRLEEARSIEPAYWVWMADRHTVRIHVPAHDEMVTVILS